MMANDVVLREVIDSDLPIFFEHQRDPQANAMAAFPAREREAFMAHWQKIRSDEKVVLRTIMYAGEVAGNIVSWEQSGKREVGYWIGRLYWGRGIATAALSAFLGQVRTRPLYAHVAHDNKASLRVLQKCGFMVGAEVRAPPNRSSPGTTELIMKLE